MRDDRAFAGVLLLSSFRLGRPKSVGFTLWDIVDVPRHDAPRRGTTYAVEWDDQRKTASYPEGVVTRKSVAYWLATGLLALAMGGGGVLDLTHADAVMDAFSRLGYPEYFATILGVGKLLGVVVVLSPGLPRLKEWAYAGFVIDVSGAFASHLFVGDPLADLVPPIAVLAITMASWAQRPESRRLA